MIEDSVIHSIAESLPLGTDRLVVAIAGAPGSGKSTLADALTDYLGKLGHEAVLVPMDGFHLDNRVLDQRDLRAKKGAPETFDHTGFAALVRRIKAGEDVVAPIFDRNLDLAIAGASPIPSSAKIVVVEGNYLLLDEDGWRELADIWDFKIYLDVSEAVLEDRLIARWTAHGFDLEKATVKALSNDIPNARRVVRNRQAADLTVEN